VTTRPWPRVRKVTCIAIRSKVTCLGVPIISSSAHRHDISNEDMLHALRNPVWVTELDDGFTMFAGPARDGTLLEVGVVDSSDGPVIIHANLARPKYLPGGDR
jgi:hypothetical protein